MDEDRSVWEGESFADLDWYARDLSGEEYRSCTFRDVDLTEAVSRGATFESCVFDNCRLNASTHTASILAFGSSRLAQIAPQLINR